MAVQLVPTHLDSGDQTNSLLVNGNEGLKGLVII